MANITPGSTQPVLPTDIAPLKLRQAFEATGADRAALREDELSPVRFDMVSAIVTALGCLPKIAPFRAQIASGIAMYDLSSFDKLESYSHGLMFALTQLKAAGVSDDPIESLSREMVEVRERLLADVTALEARKLIDGRRAELRGSVGYKNQAADVLLLASVLRSRWSVIVGKCAVTLEELSHAELLVERTLAALGAREQGPKTPQAEAEDRARAYTLFARAHDEVRRVITFLRWHEDDIEEIFPTLFNGRSKHEARSARAAVDPEADTKPGIAPSNGNGGNGAAKPAISNGQPIGMAGSDPLDK